MTKLPLSLQARIDIDAIVEDLRPHAGMTIDERSRVVSEPCRWARDVIEASPDPVKAWQWEDRRSPESLALWKSLMTRRPGRRPSAQQRIDRR
jgi:hypothetical protein